MDDLDHVALRRLDLNLLIAFDALVVERNVTRAAARLCLGQPATSHALARLREVFGDELLYREGSGMVLTERARQLAPRVRELLQAMQALAISGAEFDPARAEGQFELALNDPLEALLLPGLMARLQARAPGLSISVRPIPAWQQLDRLDEGEIQLAVGYFPSLRAVHERHELYSARFACVYNPALVEVAAPVDLAQLAGLAHVHTSYTGDGPGLVDQAFRRKRLQRRVVARTATPLSIPFVVKQSPLVAILPDLVTRLFVSHADLRILPVELDDLRLPLSMVLHRRDQSNPLVAFIMQELLAVTAAVLPA